jgi:hypothetical protein
VALGVTHPPRSTQLRRQLLFQHAAGLDEEAAIAVRSFVFNATK